MGSSGASRRSSSSRVAGCDGLAVGLGGPLQALDSTRTVIAGPVVNQQERPLPQGVEVRVVGSEPARYAATARYGEVFRRRRLGLGGGPVAPIAEP